LAQPSRASTLLFVCAPPSPRTLAPRLRRGFHTPRGTKPQAQAQAAKILASLASGEHVDPSTETMARFVECRLKDRADSNVSNKTWTRDAQLPAQARRWSR
jgi:hypothetical protein